MIWETKAPPIYGETIPASTGGKTVTEDLKRKTAAGKPPLHLLQLPALIGAARVREYGDSKYAPGNWLLADDTPETYQRYAGAALRHLMGMQGSGGEFYAGSCTRLDDEPDGSGLPHIDHAIMSLVMLREILMRHGHMKADPGQKLFTPNPTSP